MAKKEDDKAKAAEAAGSAAADLAPATQMEHPSGAIIEPEVMQAIDLSHESVDANPREGTTVEQNQIDWNDAKRAKPHDADFAGEGLDTTVYGKDGQA